MSKESGFGNIVKQAQELQERLAKVQEDAARERWKDRLAAAW